MTRACMIALIASAMAFSESFAGTLKVPQEYEHIRQAISVAKDGDTVLVAPGTYTENSIRLAGKKIVVKSLKGPTVTIIQSNETNRHIFVVDGGEGRGTRIEGFTIRNGSASDGGGIYI